MLKRGYGEAALDYIDALEQRKDVQVLLRSRLDLERSRAMRVAAGEAYDESQREARLKAAKEYLDKFIEENPAHPHAGFAMLSGGDSLLQEAQFQIAVARQTEDETEKKAAFDTARQDLEEAKVNYNLAIKRLKDRLDAMPPKSAGSNRQDAADELRTNTEGAWLEGRFQTGYCDYLAAQTLNAQDPEQGPDHKQRLVNASRIFDSIFQDYRGLRIAVLAHFWHGRVLEEMGDEAAALELYEETLFGEPDPKDATEEDVDLYGQANLFHFRLAIKEMDKLEAARMGEEWLADHEDWEKNPHYQGLVLEVAKLKADLLSKVTKTAKAKGLREIAADLAEVGKVNSEYRHEALLLRQKLLADADFKQDGMSIEELIVMGDEALESKDWSRAQETYEQALEQAKVAKPPLAPERQKFVVDRLSRTRYQLALQAFQAGKLDEALTLAGAIVRDEPDGATGPDASEIAVAVSVQLLTTATDENKPAALERVQRITEFVLKKWPDKAVGDDARMALAQAALSKGNTDEAVGYLKLVTSQSRRYSFATQILGQIRWNQYVSAKKSGAPPEETTALRAEVVQFLTESCRLQKESWQATREAMPQSLFETQFLLAEVHSEAGELAAAAPLYAPLIEHVGTTKPPLTPQLLRLFIGAVRAQLAAEASEAAAATVLLAAQVATDAAQPNAVVVDLTKLLNKEALRLEGAVITDGANPDATAKSKAALESLRKHFADTLNLLAERKELTTPQLIYLGDVAAKLGNSDQSRDFYLRGIAALAPANPGDPVDPAITRVRAKLIGVLRDEGKLEEALRQAEELVKAHPHALEPLLEKGRILLSVAKGAPERYEECVGHWTNLRLMLSKVQPRPPEYYEAIYNVAFSLFEQAKATNSSEKSTQGVQLLRSTLVLSPNLSGPDMVAKFNQLLKSAPGADKQSGRPTASTSVTGKQN